MANDRVINDFEKEMLRSLERLHPGIRGIVDDITEAYLILRDAYINDRKVLVTGNGGSAADAEHIVGELMKRFRIERPISEEMKESLVAVDAERGLDLSSHLESPLSAISLVSNISLSTAYINDVSAENVYAQQVLGLARNGDVLVAISTSGNSENIVRAAIVAKAIGCKVVGLTGRDGGLLRKFADVSVIVPEKETYRIQELHLPIYHCWCIMLEHYFFNDNR